MKIVVIGGGVVGAASAVILANEGHRVTLLDARRPPHTAGSSHGDGRIVRYTYAEPEYLELARIAIDDWRRFEGLLGRRLLETTGSWECGTAHSPQLTELTHSLDAAGIAYERLDAVESRRRFPTFHLDDASQAIFQTDGAIIRADAAVTGLWQLATRAGVDTRVDCALEGLDFEGSRLQLRCRGLERSLEADRVLFAVGPWTSRLIRPLGLDLQALLSVCRETVAYFGPRVAPADSVHRDHGAGVMPTLIDYHGQLPFYALPAIDGGDVKVGLHHSGLCLSDEQPSDHVSDASTPDAAVVQRLIDYVSQRFPGLEPRPTSVSTCLYTNTSDYDFVLDHLPMDRRLVIAAGFSGHGFKFAPALGRVLADLVLERTPSVDMTRFSLARFALADRRQAQRSLA